MRPEWSGERDNHFGVSQMVSALVATTCVFNSHWNLTSFLDAGQTLLDKMPDAVPKTWIERIRAKSEILPVPMGFDDTLGWSADEQLGRELGPTIVWNHRWEHDKNPDTFFNVLLTLKDRGTLPTRRMWSEVPCGAACF